MICCKTQKLFSWCFLVECISLLRLDCWWRHCTKIKVLSETPDFLFWKALIYGIGALDISRVFHQHITKKIFQVITFINIVFYNFFPSQFLHFFCQSPFLKRGAFSLKMHIGTIPSCLLVSSVIYPFRS